MLLTFDSLVMFYQVMSGSGHLQTFRLLRFLRNRNSSDGHTSYGIQVAVSSHSTIFNIMFGASHKANTKYDGGSGGDVNCQSFSVRKSLL